MKFNDLIYGEIEMPSWAVPFIKLPEFLRLRGVRLSNIDSIEFKDLNAQTRWDHSIGVGHLAHYASRLLNLDKKDTIHLTIAALLHDIATPPFAHTIESIFSDYNHEYETYKILTYTKSDYSDHNTLVYFSQHPKFIDECKKLTKTEKIRIDPNSIAETIIGRGQWGHLIKGSIDLDNIDNVFRVAHLMGNQIDKKLPYSLVNYICNLKSQTNLRNSKNEFVKSWLGSRNFIYSNFYNSSTLELGREALLQHILFKCYKFGYLKESMIWNTDDKLLMDISANSGKYSNNIIYSNSVKDLINKYYLLETLEKLGEIKIFDERIFSKLGNPDFVNWIRSKIITDFLDIYIIVKKKKFLTQYPQELFEDEIGKVVFFKHGNSRIKVKQLPDWMQKQFKNKRTISGSEFVDIVNRTLKNWAESNEYLSDKFNRSTEVVQRLDGITDWSFRLSKNKSLHTYPGTFVYAIPATLIKSLGLKSANILDPFAGTGQTGFEAIKYNCKVTLSDINKIAVLNNKVRFGFLDSDSRRIIKEISYETLECEKDKFYPKKDLKKWHHPKTAKELSQILNFINKNKFCCEIKNFLLLAFSNILNSCTERKGKQHGYFADNTPLPKGKNLPDYKNAISAFLEQIRKSLKIIEEQYVELERLELDPKKVFDNVVVLNRNVKSINELSCNFDGIITSPPYLCMADYTLGQRLSYYWLFEGDLKSDFDSEIGARRNRFSPQKAFDRYQEDMFKFFSNSYALLRENGYLALVIGAPVADSYKEKPILNNMKKFAVDTGFKLIWNTKREIHWHRNHGYARLKNEQIIVFQKS